jgi:hypothetical protein
MASGLIPQDSKLSVQPFDLLQPKLATLKFTNPDGLASTTVLVFQHRLGKWVASLEFNFDGNHC